MDPADTDPAAFARSLVDMGGAVLGPKPTVLVLSGARMRQFMLSLLFLLGSFVLRIVVPETYAPFIFLLILVIGVVLLVTSEPWRERLPSLAVAWPSARGASRLRIRIADPPEGCSEAYLDCLTLMVTNDGKKSIRATANARLNGNKEVRLRWEPDRIRETMITPQGGTGHLPLFIRSRVSGTVWNPHLPSGMTIPLQPGVVYAFDDTFQMNGVAGETLQPGKNYVAIDVYCEDGSKFTQSFAIWVPAVPAKMIWIAEQVG